MKTLFATPAVTQSAYQQLETAVLPLMTHFQTDLTTHDRNAIEANPAAPFLHYACKMHTVIVFLDASTYPPAGKYVPYLFGSADRNHLLREVTNVATAYIRPGTETPDLVHHFDGKRLRRIDVDKAIEIAREFTRRIQGEWNSR